MNPNDQTILQLRDIHLPPPPGWWPPAPGWWIVSALLLILFTWLSRVILHRYHQHRQCQRLLTRLDTLLPPNGNLTPQDLIGVSTLLRRLALMHYPRRRVAALTGEDWLRFLDETGATDQFTRGPGRILASDPYRPMLTGNVNYTALNTLLRNWIKRNSKS